MTEFDPSTSYDTDWELADRREFADWEPDNQGLVDTNPLWRVPIKSIVLRRGNVTNTDFASLAATVGISSATAAFLVANPTDQDFNPRVNDILAMDDGVRMLITGFEISPIGAWNKFLVEPERVDV